ncbi:MAG: DUF1667 domain-containing protein [Peptostreptococcaceae bacterium]|nr:DUF1667 domain-containing protein [Peptostreptococcaceae bacterium]
MIDKTFTCIVCPNGCKLNATVLEDNKLVVTGNKCIKGIDFANNEIFNPKRMLTTTVKTTFNSMPYLPVRTESEIPKEKVFQVMNVLRTTVIKRQLKVGDIVIENVLDTGINVIATMNTEEKRYG